MEGPTFTVELVPCYVCGESGKVSKWVFWQRDCSACDGTGKRKILIADNLSEADKWMVRSSAIHGSLNYYPQSPVGLFGIANNAANRWF